MIDYTNNQYLIIISTMYRSKIFDNTQKKQKLTDIIEKMNEVTDLIVTNVRVENSYIQFTLSFPPRISLSNAIKNIKGYSAREWFKYDEKSKEKCYQGHLWAKAFYYESIGKSDKRKQVEFLKMQKMTEYRKSHLKNVITETQLNNFE